MYEIVIDYNANKDDMQILHDAMIASTEKTLSSADFIEKSFSIFLKDGSNKIYGGIIARYDLESVYIDTLWIDDNLRKKGYGTQLLNVAENEAARAGCRYSTLDTWSFQAEHFYLKNGYFRLGEIKNYWLHYSKIFLRKNLNI